MVYVASPYSLPDPVENTHHAIAAGERLDASGVITAYVPHMNLLWHIVYPHDVDFWYAYDVAFLARCDALYRLPGQSQGADDEVAYMNDGRKPVFYDEEGVILWAKEWLNGAEA
jgi:hypothetical protein